MLVLAAVMKRIGPRYSDVTLDNFEVSHKGQQEVVDALRKYATHLVLESDSILLFGPPGTGKDHLLVAMLRAAAEAGLFIQWTDGAELFAALRDSIGSSTDSSIITDRYAKSDVLGLSDPVPPRGEITPYQSEMLFRIIDQRYRAMKPTWVTLNVADRAEAEQRIGTNIIDRLGHGALALHCNWPSHRQR